MRVVPALSTRSLAAGTLLAVLAFGALADGGGAAVPSCPTFASQAAAQEIFTSIGGDPRSDLGGLDDDHDGVACEELPGPHAGFATIGYNRERRFFYGVASMPSIGSGFACLEGNRHFPDGPRLLRIYRALPGSDRPISADIGAEARPESGHLYWKLDREAVPPGLYYAVFEEQIRSSPYAPSDCPAFRSRESYLPRRPAPTRSPRSGSSPRPPLRELALR